MANRFDGSARIPAGNTNFYLGTTPKPDIEAAAIEAVKNPPPAIVEKAHKGYQWHENQIKALKKKMNHEMGKALDAYKDSEDWKEQYTTWEDACETGVGLTKQYVNRVIAAYKESQSKVLIAEPQVPIKNNLSNGSCTSEGQSPTSSLFGKPGPDSEIPPKRTESGKPKRDLSIWKEIEERLLGVAANRVDTLNHECPNPVFHKKLQDQLSACFATLAMWRESVK